MKTAGCNMAQDKGNFLQTIKTCIVFDFLKSSHQ